MQVEDTEWDQLNRGKWRGIGLTDPIKNVEVFGLSFFKVTKKPTIAIRTNGFSFPLSSK